MTSRHIEKQLVKELGDDVIDRINDLKNDDRSSYLSPISFEFHLENTDVYYLKESPDWDMIPLPELYNNWQVFNNNNWQLICKFNERALDNYGKMDINTRISIEYTLYFDGTETIKEVMETIRNHPSYGGFAGIQRIGEGFTYELQWDT